MNDTATDYAPWAAWVAWVADTAGTAHAIADRAARYATILPLRPTNPERTTTMPTSTLTDEKIAELRQFLSIEHFPHFARGLGTLAEPCTLAAVTTINQTSPIVSTKICRFRPLTFFPAS